MATPSKKSPEMEHVIDSFNPFGRKRIDSIKADICTWCGKPAIEFRDIVCAREYTISGFCQSCQDEAFGKEE